MAESGCWARAVQNSRQTFIDRTPGEPGVSVLIATSVTGFRRGGWRSVLAHDRAYEDVSETPGRRTSSNVNATQRAYYEYHLFVGHTKSSVSCPVITEALVFHSPLA